MSWTDWPIDLIFCMVISHDLVYWCVKFQDVSVSITTRNSFTYPKISNKHSYSNILKKFPKFCLNNHPTLGQILSKFYGDHVIFNCGRNRIKLFFTLSKTQNSSKLFMCLPVMTTLNNFQWAVLCINITCLKFYADISYRSKDINILKKYERRNRAAIFHHCAETRHDTRQTLWLKQHAAVF